MLSAASLSPMDLRDRFARDAQYLGLEGRLALHEQHELVIATDLAVRVSGDVQRLPGVQRDRPRPWLVDQLKSRLSFASYRHPGQDSACLRRWPALQPDRQQSCPRWISGGP